ncbi:zinc finger protein, putative [Bodo saltans]|uniref:Zinc finger protein, putative n=1 Tax=Bodo saltans TaxID=75058 RepID=A0A0S4IP20_BODSA|nr:zinc finger protein, putative [Bodo saltans]|eukprot:CUE97851.1 zinc finger protein, putative [Bodo saltans]
MPAPHSSSSAGGGGKRSGRKAETNANHLISFQYRAPQQVGVSPPLGSIRHGGGGGGGRRHAPLDPEKVKVAYKLLNLQYLVYPDIAAAAMQANHNSNSTGSIRGPETPTQPAGSTPTHPPPVAYVKAAQSSATSMATIGKEAARSMLNYDGIISWDYVYAVVFRSDASSNHLNEDNAGSAFQCPICLEVPCAPRITPCGHIYCLPCILRFLILQKEEQHQRTCPVCHSMLVQKQLKRVLFQSVSPVKERSKRTFVLVHREKNSPLLLAHTDVHLCDAMSTGEENHTVHPSCDGGARIVLPRYEEDSSSKFARYSIATEDLHGLHQVLDESALEERKLDFLSSVHQPITRDEALEVRALDESLVLVQRYAFEFAQARQQQQHLPTSTLMSAQQSHSSTSGFHASSPSQVRERQTSMSMSPDPTLESSNSGGGGNPFATAGSSPLTVSSSSAAGCYPFYDLYMDAEGQPIFLHFVCSFMILDDCRARGIEPPCSVEVDVLDIESVTQTEQIRTVLKPLAFIPLCGTVRTVFCNMKSGLVGSHTIKAFKEVLDRRMQRIAEVRREQEERNDAAASLDDAWERHKAARRQADPMWRDTTPPFGSGGGGGVSPTMEAFAQPEDLPTLESLPPATMSYTSASASTEKTNWSVGGPSDSSLETRQRGCKGRCDDITDALTATNLSAAAATPPPPVVALGAWGAPKSMDLGGANDNAAVRLFTSGRPSNAPAAQPTWGGKPFVHKTTVKGAVIVVCPSRGDGAHLCVGYHLLLLMLLVVQLGKLLEVR